jgi:hypothetical protein
MIPQKTRFQSVSVRLSLASPAGVAAGVLNGFLPPVSGFLIGLQQGRHNTTARRLERTRK